jgi:hypothetical protein
MSLALLVDGSLVSTELLAACDGRIAGCLRKRCSRERVLVILMPKHVGISLYENGMAHHRVILHGCIYF